MSSKYNFQKISHFKQVLEPTGEQKIPVVFHVSDELMPDDRTVDQLIEVASDPRLFKQLVALTDVSEKPGRRNAGGTVAASEDYFLPQLLDTAPNCGMRLMTTPFDTESLTEEKIDQLFQELVKVIPTKKYIGNYVPLNVVIDICQRGSRALNEYLNYAPDQYQNIHSGGNMFEDEKPTKKDFYETLPAWFYRFGQFRLGILGAAGNHFLDLMKVEEIMDNNLALKFNLKKGQYVFWIHTGSGLFGQYASYFYTPKIKEHLSQRIVWNLGRLTFLKKNIPWHQALKKEIPAYRDKKEFFAIKADSELGEKYFTAHRAGSNIGFANRTMIEFNLSQAIEKTLGKKNALDLVYDMNHVYAARENHFGKDLWIHRQNTTRAFGPQRMAGTNFAETGEPIFMPSSMSTAAYFGVGTDENEETFFSCAHGTGKSKEKTSEVPENKDALLEKMNRRGVKLYNAKSKGVINQDAAHYKDPEIAIEGLKENKIMKPVAKMRPVAVLMY
ncbi:MAG TPA: RtcB family protein [Candidatus Moranbacteria bacterium]|nr:RtcB family protein [Candidatus Moranbacteria bacterium]